MKKQLSILQLIKSIICKHNSFVSSSCPFTGNTYTYCEKCEKKIKTEKTGLEKNLTTGY